MTVIDIHTHMLSRRWIDLLQQHGKPRYEISGGEDGTAKLSVDGHPFFTPSPEHFDYAQRMKSMDAAGVDVAVVSLTCPNVYWGSEEISLKAARAVNDDMARAQGLWPDRIRWLASLPWQYPSTAIGELERSRSAGSVGVMVLANIDEKSLTNEMFAPVWRAIDGMGLPVLIHPTVPPAFPLLNMASYSLVASIGFMMDTTVAVSRMIFDGFFSRYPNIKFIVAHGGATLPYLAGRLDECFRHMPPARGRLSSPPSEVLRNLYYDSITYRPEALKFCVDLVGGDRVMFGSDYPHVVGNMSEGIACVNTLPSSVQTAIRGGNAARIFNL